MTRCNTTLLQKYSNDQTSAINELENIISSDSSDANAIQAARANVLSAMKNREAAVKLCVDSISSLENINDTQQQSKELADISIKLARRDHENAMRKYDDLKAIRAGKTRMIEINTYYSKQYEAYIGIFKIIFMWCIPLVVFALLKKEELVDDTTYFRLNLLVIVIAFFMVAARINDMYWRNNFEYDTYEWLFDTPKPETENWRTGKLNPLNKYGTDLLREDPNEEKRCSGSQCCGEGTILDSSLKKCIPSN